MNSAKVKNENSKKRKRLRKKHFDERKLPVKKTETESLNETDSDDDEEIRNELQSSSIFKKIQKLTASLPPDFNFVNSLGEESDESEKPTVESKNDTSSDDSEILDSKNPSLDDASSDNSEILEKYSVVATSNKKDKLSTEISMKKSQAGTSHVERPPICNFNRTASSKRPTSTLRNKALEKLQGAKFRYLNEKLYTENGAESFDYFQKNRDEYLDYHKGYNLQVAKWPLNPVDKIISSLENVGKNLAIADMGCGDAKIARTLSNCCVHSFDLVPLNDFVTPCNISKVPLSKESVDVVVFCLSLMGTNLKEYLQEAYRIVKYGGILKIAEVESRIPNMDQFIKSIQSLGFSMEKKDVEHKLFIFLEFRKMKKKKGAKVPDITLKPCLYKKR